VLPVDILTVYTSRNVQTPCRTRCSGASIDANIHYWTVSFE